VARIKLFTVDQAEKALPLVRRIVSDVVRLAQEREEKMLERQKLPQQPPSGSNAEEKAFALERDILQSEEDIRRCQEELDGVGVELKDYHIGLIDFYSRLDGKVVYLCWKLGEDETLAWWHDLHGGFRGRQPITPNNRTRFKGLESGQKFVELA